MEEVEKKEIVEGFVEEKKKRSSWKIFLIIFFSIIVLVAIYFYFSFAFKPTKLIFEVDSSNVFEGVLLNLTHESEVNFDVGGIESKFLIKTIFGSSVDFSLNGRPYSLEVGEKNSYDLDGDLRSDLFVEFKNKEDGAVLFYFKQITNFVCPENWECTGWGPCIDGNQSKICLDQNSCGTENEKPVLVQTC